jgi:1,4-dihydroxy-2-naphthoate octaprenyltransferase
MNTIQLSIQRAWAFIRLGRLHFLVGGFILYWLGAVIALYSGVPFDPQSFLLGQIAVTAIQLMTHYANDYFDLEADRANRTPTRWSGGSRVLPDALLRPQVALRAAVLLALLALIAIAILTLSYGLMALLLLLSAQLLAWSYSAPPLRLHSRGLGELTVAIVVPGLTTMVGFYLQARAMIWLPVLAAIPLCLMQFAMLLIIEFPDADGDRVVSKRTLVVRLGAENAARLHTMVLLAAYLCWPLLASAGLPIPAVVAVGLTAPLALWQIRRLSQHVSGRVQNWNSLAFWSIVLLIAAAALELVIFALLVGMATPMPR